MNKLKVVAILKSGKKVKASVPATSEMIAGFGAIIKNIQNKTEEICNIGPNYVRTDEIASISIKNQ